MSLPDVWFVLVAVFWVGFFVLEGFDFGVGMLHRVVGRSEQEQRLAINSIGPFWDGNEVWLIVAGAATFAAFPSWYATWFSAGYLALVLVLAALIIRGVSFEFRGKGRSGAWRATWSWTMTIGSVLVPLLLGVALGDLLAGLPIDSSEEFTGTFWDLLTPFGLSTGVALLLLSAVHGATFLGLRTSGTVHTRARRAARLLSWPCVVVVAVFGGWGQGLSSGGVWRMVLPVLATLATICAALLIRRGSEGAAFTATAIAIGSAAGSLFAFIYPAVMVSSTTASNTLTVAGTASGDYALRVMTVVAVLTFPLVLLYQGWTYYVFRRRLVSPPEPMEPSTVAD